MKNLNFLFKKTYKKIAFSERRSRGYGRIQEIFLHQVLNKYLYFVKLQTG